jgi:hypothetical protein
MSAMKRTLGSTRPATGFATPFSGSRWRQGSSRTPMAVAGVAPTMTCARSSSRLSGPRPPRSVDCNKTHKNRRHDAYILDVHQGAAHDEGALYPMAWSLADMRPRQTVGWVEARSTFIKIMLDIRILSIIASLRSSSFMIRTRCQRVGSGAQPPCGADTASSVERRLGARSVPGAVW